MRPVWYWLDLLDTSGRPSNAKVLYTAAFFLNAVGVLVFGWVLVRSGAGLTATWLVYALGVLSFAGGHDVFKTFLKTRAAGLAEAVKEAEAARVKTEHFDAGQAGV